MKKEDFVICISAKPNKINIEMTFQSVKDETKFYYLKREVMTMMLKKMCYCVDNPPILIITYGKNNQVYDIRYGYKNYQNYLEDKKDIFYHRPLSTVFNNLFAWIVGPLLMTLALILILNCFYNWWWNWGDWFIKYRP